MMSANHKNNVLLDSRESAIGEMLSTKFSIKIDRSIPTITKQIDSNSFLLHIDKEVILDVENLGEALKNFDTRLTGLRLAMQKANDKIAELGFNHTTQDAVFNKLTNNGTVQGIFLDGGKLWINGEYIKAKSITADKLHADVLSANNIVSTINGGSTTINGNKITTGSITADMITSGTFKGTNFEAGGSGANGQILVKDTNNAVTFIADKNGTKAKEIQFLENPNGGSNNINTILRKDGVSISYSDPSNELGSEFYNSTQYNFYGLTMSRSTQNTNYTINATSEINTFGSSYRRYATGREEGMSGAVMFGLAGHGKQSGSYIAPAIIYDDTYRNGFTIATSDDESLKTFNFDTWSGTGTVFRIDSDGITSVRGLNIMGGSKSLTFENQYGGGQMNSLINCRSLQNATGNGQMLTAHNNTVYVGNPNTPLYIESGINPTVVINGAQYQLYHTGNKPSWQDVGAIRAGNWTTNGGQDLLVHNKRALVGFTNGELHLGYG